MDSAEQWGRTGPAWIHLLVFKMPAPQFLADLLTLKQHPCENWKEYSGPPSDIV